jgi:hypothetical protein
MSRPILRGSRSHRYITELYLCRYDTQSRSWERPFGHPWSILTHNCALLLTRPDTLKLLGWGARALVAADELHPAECQSSATSDSDILGIGAAKLPSSP